MANLKKKLGNALQKLNESVNLVHMIDLLERQDAVAQCLQVNEGDHQREEEERRRLCREAAAACFKELHEHCLTYLKSHPKEGSFEDWIVSCHPDNVDLGEIDHRFYVEDSDHRIIWNSYCDMHSHSNWKVQSRNSIS